MKSILMVFTFLFLLAVPAFAQNISINNTNYSMPSLNNTITNDLVTTVVGSLGWIYSSISNWTLNGAIGIIPHASPTMLFYISVLAGLITLYVAYNAAKQWADIILLIVIIVLFIIIILMALGWI